MSFSAPIEGKRVYTMQPVPDPLDALSDQTRSELANYARRSGVPVQEVRRLVLYLMAQGALRAQGYEAPDFLLENAAELLMRTEHESRVGILGSAAFEGLLASHSQELDKVAEAARDIKKIWEVAEKDVDAFFSFGARLVNETLGRKQRFGSAFGRS